MVTLNELTTGKTINVQRTTRKFPERVMVVGVNRARKRVLVETRDGERFSVALAEVQPNPHQSRK